MTQSPCPETLPIALPSTPSRLASPEDQPFLEGLFLVTHRSEFAPLGLGETELDTLLRMQARAQRLSYARTFPAAVDRILLDRDGQPAGRLLVDRTPDAVHLVDIAILPEDQGRGLGTAALETLLDESRRTGLPVRLQVQAANRAQVLYQRLGFAVTGAGLHLQMEFRPEAATPAADTPQSSAMSPEAREWTARIGREYTLNHEEIAAGSSLRLHAVVPAHHQPLRGFSLFFRAIKGPAFWQGLYTLRRIGAPDAGSEEHLLFLVPLGPVEGVMQYEAVFTH